MSILWWRWKEVSWMMLMKNVEGYNLPLPQEGQPWNKEQFPSQNELMQEQQRLQQEHASAVQRGDMATARRMERLMQMNSARMQNYAMKSEEWFELVKQTNYPAGYAITPEEQRANLKERGSAMMGPTDASGNVMNPQQIAIARRQEAERKKAQEAANAAALQRTQETRAKTSEGIANLDARMNPPETPTPTPTPQTNFDERLSALQTSVQSTKDDKQQRADMLAERQRAKVAEAEATEARGQEQDENFAFFEQQQAETDAAKEKANAEKQKKQAQLARQKGKEAANRRRLMEGAKAKVGQQASRLLGEPSLPNVETGARVASLPGKVIPAIGSAVDAMRPSSVASAINTVTGGAANRITKPGREVAGQIASKVGQRVADPATRLASGQQLSEERQKKQERTQSEMGDYATDARARSILTRNVNPDGTRRKKGEMNITAEDEKTIAEIQRIESILEDPDKLAAGNPNNLDADGNPRPYSDAEIEAMRLQIENLYGGGISDPKTGEALPIPTQKKRKSSASKNWFSRLLYGDRFNPKATKEVTKMKKGVDPDQENDHYRVNKQPPVPPLAEPPGAPPPMDMSGMDPASMGIGMPMIPQTPAPAPNMSQGPPDPETGEPRTRGKEFTVDPEEEADDEMETSMNKSEWFNTLKPE